MKKTKLLAPLLAVASLGATITPAIMLTSCSCGGDTDTGKEVEKSEFINKLNTVQSSFEANHNSFKASEIIYSKYINVEGEIRTYDCTAVNETEEVESDTSNRLVTLTIESSTNNTLTVSAKTVVTEMKNIIDNTESKYSNFKYLEFNNYYQLQYQEEFESNGTTYVTTFIREIYKNGFFKRWKGETRVKETGKIHDYEGEWVDYSTAPHVITNFEFGQDNNLYKAYLEKDVTYTATFSSSNSQINCFGAFYSNESVPVFYTLKDVEFTVDGNNDTNNWTEEGVEAAFPKLWKRSSKLNTNQKVVVKFKLNEDAGHYALIIYNSN